MVLFFKLLQKLLSRISFADFTFSYEGEDRILNRLISDKSDGFYVDVGAHHPIRFSNTFYFYLKNWRGINIDAQRGSSTLFTKIRDRDINIECAVGNSEEELVFHEFNEPALNTFDTKLADEYLRNSNYKIVRKVPLQMKKLVHILDAHLPPGQKIDFLSVDVEGYDLSVLESNDWVKYRPNYVLCEILDKGNNIFENNIYQFLIKNKYEFISKTLNTFFFKSIN